MDIMKYLIPVVLFSALIGTIAGYVTTASGNLSGASAVLVGLTTLIIAIVFLKWVSKGAGR